MQDQHPQRCRPCHAGAGLQISSRAFDDIHEVAGTWLRLEKLSSCSVVTSKLLSVRQNIVVVASSLPLSLSIAKQACETDVCG